MRRTCLAALCLSAVLGSPSAWPQDQDGALALSPDGKLLAVARHVTGKKLTKSWALDVVDTDCLLSGRSVSSCTRAIAEELYLPPNNALRHVQWARDSKRLITNYRVFDTSAGALEPERFRQSSEIQPRVFEPEFLATDPRQLYGPHEIVDRMIVNGRSQLVGQVVNRFPRPKDVEDMWGHKIAAPNLVTQLEVRSLASEPGFFLWTGEASDRGLLAEFKPSGLTTFEVPADLHGPARVVWDTSNGGAVAFFDPFGVYPLPERLEALRWLQEFVDTTRVEDPSAELVDVSVSTDGNVAYLHLLKGLACNESLIVKQGKARTLFTECSAWAKDARPPLLTPVTIPTAEFDLRGQLYAWPAAPGTKPRGLLISFHGGPQRDLMSDRTDTAARMLSDQFDMLMVDYRGSTGRGEAYMESLKQPVADISAQDLQSVLNWVEGQEHYRGRRVGFWGTSWGGLAGYAALSHDVRGLDFIIVNNGFLENPPAARTSICKVDRHWKKDLFGFVVREDGSCLLNEAGILGRPIKSLIPVLMLYGENDINQTPVDLARDWAAEATDQNVCVSIVTSKTGGHSMLGWSTPAQDGARMAVRNWLENLQRGSRKACGARSTLP